MSFGRCESYERFIDGFGLKWKYHERASFSELARDWDKNNPCRDGGAISTEWDKYAVLMIDGAIFPPVIVTRVPDGLQVIDGRTRLFAKREADGESDESFFGCYEVLGASKKTIELMQVAANTALNGVRPSVNFSLQQGIEQYSKRNCSMKEAAKIAAVTLEKFKTHLRSNETHDRLVSMGIEPAMKNGSLAAMNPVDDDNVLQALYHAAAKANLTIPLLEELVDSIKRTTGKGGKLEVINKFMCRTDIKRRTQRGAKRVQSPQEKLRMALKTAITALKGYIETATVDPLNADELKEFDKYLHSIDGLGRKAMGRVTV